MGALDVNLDSEREPGVGDRFVFAGALHSWVGTKPDKSVGHEEVLCTFTAVHFERGWARVSCTAQFFLPGGNVTAESSLRFKDGPQKFIVPITGGTGVYFNASGSIVIRDIGKSGNNALTFNLKP